MSNIVVPDGGNIGSASDTDAISISSSGAVTFSQDINPNNFVGMIAPFGMSSVPTGWLACDGSAVSKTTYSALFTALGVDAWGTDTTDNFYLPDLRGAFLRGTGSQPLVASGGAGEKANGTAFAGPSVGSFANDEIQVFGIDIPAQTQSENAVHTNSGALAGSHGGNDNLGNPLYTPVATTEGTPRTGYETRPFNAGVKYCIKY